VLFGTSPFNIEGNFVQTRMPARLLAWQKRDAIHALLKPYR